MDFLGEVYFWDINSLNQTCRKGTLVKNDDNPDNLYNLILPETTTFDEDKNLPYFIENTTQLIGTIDEYNIFRCIDKVKFKNSMLPACSLKELKIMKKESDLKDYKDFKERVVDKNVIKNTLDLPESTIKNFPNLSIDKSKKSYLYFFSGPASLVGGPESLVGKNKVGYFNPDKTKFFENNTREIDFNDDIINYIKEFNKLSDGHYIFLNYTIAYDIEKEKEKETDNLYHISINDKKYLIILMADDDIEQYTNKDLTNEELTSYFSKKYEIKQNYSAGGKRNSVRRKKNKKSKTIKTVYRKNNLQSSRKSRKSRKH